MADLERVVEQYLHRQVKAVGGNTYKLAPIVAGTPDRLVLLPPGKVLLVELKSATGKLRPVQQVWHRNALAMGITVHVLSSKQQVDEWISGQIR